MTTALQVANVEMTASEAPQLTDGKLVGVLSALDIVAYVGGCDTEA